MNAVISPLASPGSSRAEVAAAVRAHIAARRSNDSRVARAIGMTQAKFSRRTNEGVAFDTDDLGRIASHFGISLVELIQMPQTGTTGPEPSATEYRAVVSLADVRARRGAA